MGMYKRALEKERNEEMLRKQKDGGVTEIGMARGRIDFLLQRRGQIPEADMWDTLERIQADLGKAVDKLTGKRHLTEDELKQISEVSKKKIKKVF